mmetsp:Transcript_20714/g.57567  ORF Transcript_20714/g.57567 Transcript_20714/m.57567 type:complete len:95 (-) Transcript_20714:1135-1419(-)
MHIPHADMLSANILGIWYGQLCTTTRSSLYDHPAPMLCRTTTDCDEEQHHQKQAKRGSSIFVVFPAIRFVGLMISRSLPTEANGGMLCPHSVTR